MKVLTIVAGRADIIKLSLVIKVLDQHVKHVLVRTSSERGDELGDTVFRELDIRAPDVSISSNASATPEELALKLDGVIREFAPDRILVCAGSPVTAGAALAAGSSAAQLCIAGSSNSPSELPRGTHPPLYLVYDNSERSALIQAGHPAGMVVRAGCPMFEILDSYSDRIEENGVLGALGVKPFDYFLAAVRERPNLIQGRLEEIMGALAAIGTKFGKMVLFVAHPATAAALHRFRISANEKVRLLKAMSFFDFVKLEKNALAVVTDSPSVQEECAILTVPVVTVGETLARPETIACGGNILAGRERDEIINAVEISVGQPASWDPPDGYRIANSAQIITKIILGRLPITR